MNMQHFNQNSFSHLGMPFQELIDLNIKTIQSMSYIKPEELTKIQKPEELMERNMNMLIQNSHKALEYVHHTFDILERHWSHVSGDLKEGSKKIMNQTQSVTHKAVSELKKDMKQSQKVINKSLKEVAKTSKLQAKNAVSKAKPKAKPVKKAAPAVAKKPVMVSKQATKTKPAMKTKAVIQAKPATNNDNKNVRSSMERPIITNLSAPVNQKI